MFTLLPSRSPSSPRLEYNRVAGRRPSGARGFSLIEATISLLILSVMVIAVIQLLASSAQARVIHVEGLHAPDLAQALMSEILQHAYAEPTDTSTPFSPEPGELFGSRQNFDDVDDYHGWTRSPPTTPDGTPLAGANGWSRSVQVTWVKATDLAPSGSETGLKRIVVDATSPTGQTASVTALRAHTGVTDWATNAKTYTSWTGIELQPTADPDSLTSIGVSLLNEPRRSVIANGNFEVNHDPWVAGIGSATLAAVPGDATIGGQFLRVTDRSTEYAGPQQDVKSVFETHTSYECAMWVRMASGTGTIRVKLEYHWTLFPTYATVDIPNVGTDWTPITAMFDPVTSMPTGVKLHIETASGSESFDVDGVMLMKGP